MAQVNVDRTCLGDGKKWSSPEPQGDDTGLNQNSSCLETGGAAIIFMIAKTASMSMNPQNLVRITSIILIGGLISCFINPRNYEIETMYTLHLVKSILGGVQLSWGIWNTGSGWPLDAFNLVFYMFLLAGLLKFRKEEKNTSLLRFCFSIVFLDNFLSVTIGLLSIIAAAINPYKEYPLSGFTFLYYCSYIFFVYLSYQVLNYLKAQKSLSAISHESDGVTTSFYDESSRNQRMVHLMVDTLIFILLLPRFTQFLFYFFPGDLPFDGGSEAGFYLLVFIGRFIYYFSMESIWASTPGKMLTETRITNEHGEKVGIKVIFARTLSRYIPFDSLSFFGNRGWHDSLSNTYVLKETSVPKKPEMETTLPSPF